MKQNINRATPTREDIAYFAGLFDGEGCINIASARNPLAKTFNQQHILTVRVGMTHPTAIYLLQQYFGGSVTKRLRSLKNPKHKDSYNWTASGAEAKAFLLQMHYQLITKQVELEIALDYLANRTLSRRGIKLSEEELALRNGYLLALQEAKKIVVLP